MASFVSRMGQGFSTSYQTIEADTQRIHDIEKDKYIFSDGIGKMSSEMADKVCKALLLVEQTPWRGHVGHQKQKKHLLSVSPQCVVFNTRNQTPLE